jgi:hypothetical protein
MKTLATSISLKATKKLHYSIPQPQTAAEKQLQQYIIDSLNSKMSILLPFVFNNQSAIALAKNLLRYRTGSRETLFVYVYGIYRFSNYLNTQPDQLIQNCKDQDSDPNPKAIAKYNKLLDDYVGELQAQGLTPNSVSCLIKGVKSIFRCNGIKLELN